MTDTPPKTHNSDPHHQINMIADRVSRLLDERDAITEDVRDIFAEAKGAGFEVGALKKAVAVKRMPAEKRKKWHEEQEHLDLYLTKLSVLPDA